MNELDEERARFLALLELRRKRSRRGCLVPAPVVGWEIHEAGFRTYRELAAKVPVAFEYVSRIRSGDAPLSDRLRARIAELLGIHEVQVLAALRRAPGPRWRW